MSSEQRIQLTAKVHSGDGEVDGGGLIALIIHLSGTAGELWRVTGFARVANSEAPENVRVHLFDSLFVDTGDGSASNVDGWTYDRVIVVGTPRGILSIGSPGNANILLGLNAPGEGSVYVDIDTDILIEKIDDPSQIQIALPLRG